MSVRVNRITCNERSCDRPATPGRLVAYFDGDHIAAFHFYCDEHLRMADDPTYWELLRYRNPQLEVVIYDSSPQG